MLIVDGVRPLIMEEKVFTTEIPKKFGITDIYLYIQFKNQYQILPEISL